MAADRCTHTPPQTYGWKVCAFCWFAAIAQQGTVAIGRIVRR